MGDVEEIFEEVAEIRRRTRVQAARRIKRNIMWCVYCLIACLCMSAFYAYTGLMIVAVISLCVGASFVYRINEWLELMVEDVQCATHTRK